MFPIPDPRSRSAIRNPPECYNPPRPAPMTATLLDGARTAADIRVEVTSQVAHLRQQGIQPGLGVLMAGNDPGSEIYVRNKSVGCEAAGIALVEQLRFAANATTPELLDAVSRMNSDDAIDGILVQLPLPPAVDAKEVLLAVSPDKDVDGFHPMNVGRLWSGREGLRPCTPAGIIELLHRNHIPISGAQAVVIGRSDIVGKPIAAMLLNLTATVTICHSKTRDLPAVSRTADILVAAIGKPGFVTRDFVKSGATVVDVGINRITDRAAFDRLFRGDARREELFARKGSVLSGDVHREVAEVAGALTPVPGGIGPLTIAMLLANVVKAARLRRALAASQSVAERV
jgi:methylenetetrahydrofolate dehydrogenase (NADP+) / methenyltetrahydrofolate cyclohydrolase